MIPAIKLLFHGVDVARISLNPIDGHEPVGFKGRLITMTCNQNKTWISPENFTYQIADQISSVEEISGGLKDSIQQNVYRGNNYCWILDLNHRMVCFLSILTTEIIPTIF